MTLGPLPELFFLTLFFLFGGFIALVFGLGIPRLYYWLEERRHDAATGDDKT